MGSVCRLPSSRCPSGGIHTDSEHFGPGSRLFEQRQCIRTEPQLYTSDRAPGEAWGKRGAIIVVSGVELGVHGWVYTRMYLP